MELAHAEAKLSGFERETLRDRWGKDETQDGSKGNREGPPKP